MSKKQLCGDFVGRFFQAFVDNGLYEDWAGVLDWLLNDNRFDKKYWDRGAVRSYTNAVKNACGFKNADEETYLYGCKKNVSFDKIKKGTRIVVRLIKKDSEARDFIRHIRNGIAHGNSSVIKVGSELYIEIYDYSSNMEQTAYIFMPLDYIMKLFKVYKDKEKAIIHNKKGKEWC